MIFLKHNANFNLDYDYTIYSFLLYSGTIVLHCNISFVCSFDNLLKCSLDYPFTVCKSRSKNRFD